MATAPGNDISGLMQGLGVSMPHAVLAARYMYFTPNNSDPASPSIMIIVRGLQMGLNKAGANLKADGILGPKTGEALRRIIPADVVIGTTPWYKIYAYVYQATNATTVRPDELTRARPPAATPKPGQPAGIVPGVNYREASLLPTGGTDTLLIAGAVVLGLVLLSDKPKRKGRR